MFKMSIRSHYDLHGFFCLEYYEILFSCDADGGMFVKNLSIIVFPAKYQENELTFKGLSRRYRGIISRFMFITELILNRITYIDAKLTLLCTTYTYMGFYITHQTNIDLKL
jgi:hypothetical protein